LTSLRSGAVISNRQVMIPMLTQRSGTMGGDFNGGGSSPLRSSSSPRIPMSIERIERPQWYFIVVPVVRLSPASRATLRPWQRWTRLKTRVEFQWPRRALLPPQPVIKVEVEHCNLALFVSGQPNGRGNVISFSSEWVVIGKVNASGKEPGSSFHETASQLFRRASANSSRDDDQSGDDESDHTGEDPKTAASRIIQAKVTSMNFFPFFSLVVKQSLSQDLLKTVKLWAVSAHTKRLMTICRCSPRWVDFHVVVFFRSSPSLTHPILD
jgi:hypothetical protein